MKVADTSFLVSLFIPMDKHHKEAVKIFESEDKFFVPVDIIKETLTVITYKLGYAKMREVWEFISNSEVFEIVSEDFNKLVNFYLSLSKKIAFFDACVIYFSLIEGLEPASFDKQLLSVWKAIRS